MKIADISPAERPRERLDALGPSALSDAELLAIVLRTGTTGHSAIELAQALLTKFGSLARLLCAGTAEFADLRGIGPSKRSLLLAVMELARRSAADGLRAAPVLGSSEKVREFLRLRFAGARVESFLALFLDMQCRLICCEEISRGTLDRTSVYPREVVRLALSHNAAAVVFAHNHPGGSATASPLDKLLTRELKRVMSAIEVTMIDHLIVGDQEIWSCRANGLC